MTESKVSPVLERAKRLTPLIQAYRMKAEDACRMAPAVHEALLESGMYAATAPVEVGGDELSLSDQARVTEQVAYADPSVAWCLLNSWASSSLASRLQPDARSRAFVEPNALFGFGFAPAGRAVPTPEGFRVTGRWPVVSGCEVAGRFALNSVVMNGDAPNVVDGRPDARFMLLAPEAVGILDTWRDVQGLRGSGSHAIEVKDALVASDSAVRFAAPLLIDRPAFRFGMVLPSLVGCGAALLGAARAALDGLIAQATDRVSLASGQAWRDWPNIQDTVATTAAAVLSANAGLIEASEQAWATVQDSPEAPLRERGLLYATIDHAHQTAREAVSRLYTAGSIDCLHRGHILEQSLRDVHALSVNWERYKQIHYDAGRVLMGLPPLSALY